MYPNNPGPPPPSAYEIQQEHLSDFRTEVPNEPNLVATGTSRDGDGNVTVTVDNNSDNIVKDVVLTCVNPELENLPRHWYSAGPSTDIDMKLFIMPHQSASGRIFNLSDRCDVVKYKEFTPTKDDFENFKS